MEKRKKITNYMVWMDTKLGEGAFGKVYFGEQDQTKRKVAVKMLERDKINKDDYFKKALLSEIDILKTLKSKNIVQFLDVMQSSNYYYIVQQFCNGGELRKYMNKVKNICQKQAIGFLKQICNGFRELVRQGVMHRDLKPQNILINDGVLKISDFGFSKRGQKRITNKTVVGTPLYMSLQILKALPYTQKCDIWSLGCIFYEMMHGRTPWVANTQYELIMSIENVPLNFNHQISDVSKDFIRKCLAREQNNRLSWSQLFSHPIFQTRFPKHQDTENKFKTLMNHLGFMLKSKNINLQKYFINIHPNTKTYLQFPQFKSLITYIDDNLQEEQVSYLYDCMTTHPQTGVNYEQLKKCFFKFGIHLQNPKTDNRLTVKSSPKMVSQNMTKSPRASNRQMSLRLSNNLFSLLQKLENKKMTIYEFFDASNLTQKGFIDVYDLGKILRFVDGSFTDEQIQTSFGFMDVKNKGVISLDSFVQFFFNVTCMQNVKKQDSVNSSTSMNSLTYPIQYGNHETLMGVGTKQIKRRSPNPHQNYDVNIQETQFGNQPLQKAPNYQGGNGWF